MEKASIITHQLDPLAFQEGVFFSSGDLLSPVALLPENLDLKPDMQTIHHLHDLQARITRTWWTVAVISAGQLSLLKKSPVTMVSRLDLILRYAIPQETQIDFDHFGEQVMGDEIRDPMHHDGPTMTFLGGKYIYTGPLRLKKALFISRVMSLPLNPETYRAAKEEVDEIAKPAENKELRQDPLYFLFSAEKGHTSCSVIKEGEPYLPQKMTPLGHLELIGQGLPQPKLLFHPDGKETDPIDFSQNLCRTPILGYL